MFKDLNNDDILEVETFVREEMLKFLNSKKNFDGHEKTMEFYFGPYAHIPNEFKFRIGDKKIIKMMIAHVNEMVNNGDIGLKESNQKESTQNINSSNEEEQQMSPDAAQTYYFLRKLIEAADQNANRERGGYRFSDETKQFATYIRLIAGPLAYETLQNNLKCALPSLVSVNRYIRQSNSKIIEGVPRIEELLVYLTSRNLPLKVSISEDATRIIGRVQYDSTTNQLMGFVLPINENNGMPIPFAFPAKNAESILSHFSNQNSTSQFLNVVMAQPLANVPPFGLMVYGTDNKQSTNDIIKRWHYLHEQLKEKNINLVAISTDSDPRYNSAMRYLSKLGTTSNFMKSSWFSCGNNNVLPFFVQDTVHIATKLRNFLLRTVLNRKIIPFGNRFIKMQHLVYLLTNFPKDQHELTATILNPVDRQNFASVRRMCDEKVINLLRNEVIGSEGTALFLEMVQNIIDSFIDTKLDPLERIRKIWYPLFIIRIWKEYVLKNKKYKLKDNFLTMNCYACIELNAHSLIQIMCYLKEADTESLFLPHLISSQQCESTFRLLRSLTSTYSTVTNFTTKEAINRIDKIELQNQIIHTMPQFTYPRLGKNNSQNNQQHYKLPTKAEICEVILQCKRDAIDTAVEFNLISSRATEQIKEKATACHVNKYIPKKTNNSTTFPHSQSIPIKKLALSDFENIALKNFAQKKPEPITETSPYTEFCFGSNRIVVKKTSLCWLLRDDVKKLSNDRLLRVRASGISKKNKQQINSKKKYAVNEKRVKYILPFRTCKY